MKIHKRLFALLLVFALVIGMIPSALADNEPDISAVESAEETLVESRPEESPAIAPPTQSILELDEAVEDSEVETDDEAPTSMDGETLTRMDNDGLMLLGGGGTMGKSTCVTFAAYQEIVVALRKAVSTYCELCEKNRVSDELKNMCIQELQNRNLSSDSLDQSLVEVLYYEHQFSRKG